MVNEQSVSLIISTYNWPKALELCLHSIQKQSVLPDEIIIADDGSKEPTKELIEKVQTFFPIPIVHVWQPDEGFQLAKIRNKAIAKSKYEYIIQIDGDLFLHRHFIKDHLAACEKGFFITGSRVILNKKLSDKVLSNPPEKISIFSKGITNFFNGIRQKLLGNILAKKYKTGKNKYYVKGCNMAFWKKDLIEVNGYNESFTGWGREDSELAIRLINNGIEKKFLKLQGIVYHIYHKESDRSSEPNNVTMMEQAIQNKTVWCNIGLKLYL